MNFEAYNLAQWVKSAKITQTNKLIILEVETKYSSHRHAYLKEYDNLNSVKRIFTLNFGRTDGQRTRWKALDMPT